MPVLRLAASFDLLSHFVSVRADGADGLVERCMAERSFKLAELLLDTHTVAHPSVTRAALLLAQRERQAEGFQVGSRDPRV